MNIVLRPLSFVLAAAALAAAADPATNAPPPAAATNVPAALNSPIMMRGIMASRTPGERGKILARGERGGGDATVMRALRWLKTVQCEDGSWPGHPVASTALALWCYFEHNETPLDAEEPEFARTTFRGLRFLAGDLAPKTGLFRSARGEPLAQPLGALALAMGYETTFGIPGDMSLRPLLRDAAESALRPILAGQRPDGAWNADPLDPSPEGRGDPRATFWCTLALGGGRIWTHGFAPAPAWRRSAGDALAAFLDPAADAAFRPDGAATSVTAATLFGLQRLGRFNDSAMKRGIDALAGCAFSWEAWDGPQPWGESGTPVRDWFFVTNAKFEFGGEVFRTWNKQFLPEVIARQTILPAEESGCRDLRGRPREIGWWDSPSDAEREIGSGGPVLPCKRWRGGECLDGETTLGDRVRDTCLSALPMMVYYAFLPAYQSAGDNENLAIPSPSPRPSTNAAAGSAPKIRVIRKPAPVADPHVLCVGWGCPYARPSDAAKVAKDGDTVRIAVGSHYGDECVWRANDLTIVGTPGQTTVEAVDGTAARKGIWVVQGTNVTIRGISFRGAACPDRNGAGIRHEADGALTVTDCHFERNENGFLSGVATNAVLTFERCVFRDNGAGDGLSHNLYVGRAKRLVFRDCASDHAREGHALKSRALETVVENCVFDDGDDGRSSYLVDCPNGGRVRIAGCRFVQSPVAPNGTMVSVGEEGGLYPDSTLDLRNGANRFENRRASGTEVRSLVPEAEDASLRDR